MKRLLMPLAAVLFCSSLNLAQAAEQSESVWLSNLTKAEKQHGANDVKTAEFLFAVGKYYHRQKQYDRQDVMSKRAMAIFEKSPGKNSDLLRFYTAQLADLYASQGQDAKAEQSYKKALALAEKMPGKDKTYVAPDMLNGLAGVYIRHQRYSEAEAALKLRIRMRERFMNHGQTDLAYLDLANLYSTWGKSDDAQLVFDRLSKITPLPPEVKNAYTAFQSKKSVVIAN